MKRKALTRVIHDRIVQYVRQGIPARTAATGAGIDARTFEDWMARGHRAPRGKYRAFADAIGAAEAQYEAALVLDVYEGAQKNDKIGFALMERRYAETYGRQRLVPKEQDGPVKVPARRLLLPAEEPLRAVEPRRRGDDDDNDSNAR